MPIRDYQSLILPTLCTLADGTEAPLGEIRERIAVSEKLTVEDVSQMLPSGRQTVLANRVSWALLGLERAGLVERVRRAVYRMTDEGGRLLARGVDRVDDELLATYPAFAEWKKKKRESQSRIDPPPMSDESRETPEETLTRAGDGGIDGTIREDALGLDEVYVQAKKYAEGSAVGEGDLRNFAGAIDAAGTTKGVFVTTADFTKSAREYVDRSPKRIVLIDGEELARLMVHHNVGVRTRDRYEVKRIDQDYFDQDGM